MKDWKEDRWRLLTGPKGRYMWANGSDYVSQLTTSHGGQAISIILISNFFLSISTSLLGQVSLSFGFDDYINNCSQVLISSGLTTDDPHLGMLEVIMLESFIDHNFC